MGGGEYVDGGGGGLVVVSKLEEGGMPGCIMTTENEEVLAEECTIQRGERERERERRAKSRESEREIAKVVQRVLSPARIYILDKQEQQNGGGCADDERTMGCCLVRTKDCVPPKYSI
jgi:hypothetical protein